jgi:hypothetical protein
MPNSYSNNHFVTIPPLIGMRLGESSQRRKLLCQNPGMRAGNNLDVGASFDQTPVKPNQRRSILDRSPLVIHGGD